MSIYFEKNIVLPRTRKSDRRTHGIHKDWCEDGDGITDIKGAYVAFARLDKEQKNSDLFQGGHKLCVR
ncbi:hypothetical protein D932_00337 [Enterococcus casseliflavus 14-MB-W-14]|nr:hypothetical protein D932_00337 [Enterococcus casseliflavus 14-MB-W-14]